MCMDVLTSGSVESSATSVALEVLCLLVGDEQLEILKVTFAWCWLVTGQLVFFVARRRWRPGSQ